MAFKGQVTDDEIGDKPVVSLLDSLRAQVAADSAAEFDNVSPWIPDDINDGLEGTVIGIGEYLEEKFSDEGKLLRTWIVQDNNGLRWQVIPFHFQLRKLMIKHRADVGDQVAVLYLGEEPSATDPGQFFKKYAVTRVAAGRAKRDAQRAARIMTPDKFGEKISSDK